MMRPLRPLDPTWWRKAPLGYDQQDGRARLVRLKTRTKTTSWALYIDGEYRGDWPKLDQAKHRAAEITAQASSKESCPKCHGEHCPHYACTVTGGAGYCDNCTGD